MAHIPLPFQKSFGRTATGFTVRRIYIFSVCSTSNKIDFIEISFSSYLLKLELDYKCRSVMS